MWGIRMDVSAGDIVVSSYLSYHDTKEEADVRLCELNTMHKNPDGSLPKPHDFLKAYVEETTGEHELFWPIDSNPSPLARLHMEAIDRLADEITAKYLN